MLPSGMFVSTNWKVTAVTALCGAVIGGGIALLMSANFVASTTLEIGPGAASWENRAQVLVLSRASLTEIIQRPSLDLYRAERTRVPIEDVIAAMRDAVRVRRIDGTSSVLVSFEYSDPKRAEATVAVLGARMADEITRAASADGAQVSVRRLSGPTRPERTRDRAGDLGIGIAAGAVLASALLLLRRRPAEWYVMLGFAVTGGMAAELAAYLGDIRYPADLELGVIGIFAGILAGVLLLGCSGRRLGTAGTVLAATSAGAIAAGAIAFAMPQQYVSRTILRTSTSAPPGVTAAARIGELSERVLSRTSLTEVIQRPSIDLYRAERSRRPMEQVVETMRRDLMINSFFGGGPDATLAMSFRYSDPDKARAVVRELVSKYMEENNLIARQASEEPWGPGSLNLMVIDPPSKSEIPVGPDKLQWMASGAGAGLGIVLLAGLIGRQTPPRRRLMLRLTLSAGAAAAVIAAVVALAHPARYLSTATLRMVLPTAADGAAAVDDLQTRLGQAVGSSTLVELMQRPGLDLYAKERSQLPVKDVIKQLRTRDLSIETLKVSAVGRTETLRIAFQYPDREKAHGFVQALVSKLVENGSGLSEPFAAVAPGLPKPPGPLDMLPYGVGASPAPERSPQIVRAYVEVLDPPSVPEAPQLPNREEIIAAGLIAGLLLGAGAILLGPGNPTLPPMWSAPPTA